MSATLVVTLKEDKGGVLDFSAIASANEGTELESRVATALYKLVSSAMRLPGRFLNELGGDDGAETVADEERASAAFGPRGDE